MNNSNWIVYFLIYIGGSAAAFVIGYSYGIDKARRD